MDKTGFRSDTRYAITWRAVYVCAPLRFARSEDADIAVGE
jgi:hypothetical protein